MNTDTLVRQLNRMIAQPERFETEFEDWKRDCLDLLDTLPRDQAHQLLDTLNTLVKENQSLFEQENLSIRKQLGQHSGSGSSNRTKVRQYTNINRL